MMRGFAFSLLFLLVSFELTVRFLTARLRCQTRYAQAAEEFYAVARRLARKEAASDALLDFLHFLNATLSDKVAFKILYKIAAGNKDKISRSGFKSAGAVLQLLVNKNADITERHAIENLFRQAVSFWLQAVVNHSPFYGKVFILKMSDYITDSEDLAVAAKASREWPTRSGHIPTAATA